MDLKAAFFLIFVTIGVDCEFDFASAINSTQHLQDIERGGYSQLYPSLSDNDGNVDSRAGGSRPFYVGSIMHPLTNSTMSQGTTNTSDPSGTKRPFYFGSIMNNTTRLNNEKFLNKTLTGKPSGVCTKEVP